MGAAGYGTSSRTVTAERTYPNLSDADVSLVPKSVNENGRNLTLADVSWQGNNLLVQKIHESGGIDFDEPILLGYSGLSDTYLKKYVEDSRDIWQGRVEMLDRDGGMIDAESLYDSSDEKGTLRGSIAATLQKKMLVNTAGVLFELLGKTNDRTLIASAGGYLGGAFYQLYRALHRASGGKEGYFGLDATAYRSGAVDAQMRADYIAYVSSLETLTEKDGAFATMEDEALAALYPGLMQSVTQVLHSTEEKTNSLLGRK